MTQKLTTIGQCTAFNNEQSPYPTVSHKSSLQGNVGNYWSVEYKL